MIALMCFCLRLFTLPFKSKIQLEAENAILRHQLIVLQRQIRGRIRFNNDDRLFFIWLYRWFPQTLDVLRIIRPETLVRWHRADVTGIGSPGRQVVGTKSMRICAR